MATSGPHGNPARIIILIEQQAITDVVRLTLNHGTCETREIKDVADAMAVVEEWQPHLAVIEVEFAGERLLRLIGRASESRATRVPVLALTRRGDLKTKLTAFEQGVDDIMTIPFPPEELLARVLAIIQRAFGLPMSLMPMLQLGELEIDILNRHVRVDGETLHLTGLEQSLLYLLAANAGKILSRDDIINAIWGADFVADSNIVDRHIRNLRSKLKDGWRRPRYIATIPGKGYRFIPVASGAS